MERDRAALAGHPPPGTRLRNPFNGETFIFTQAGEDAGAFRFDVLVEPGGMLTGTGRQHLHPFADEEFAVRHGRLRLMVDGAWRELGPGEALLVPKGTPHLFRNGHEGETLFTATFRPAMQFPAMFLNMASNIARHPEWYDARGEPPLLLQALTLNAYAGHAYVADLPVWLQRLVFAVLAPVALAKGYRLAVGPRQRGRS